MKIFTENKNFDLMLILELKIEFKLNKYANAQKFISS